MAAVVGQGHTDGAWPLTSLLLRSLDPACAPAASVRRRAVCSFWAIIVLPAAACVPASIQLRRPDCYGDGIIL